MRKKERERGIRTKELCKRTNLIHDVKGLGLELEFLAFSKRRHRNRVWTESEFICHKLRAISSEHKEANKLLHVVWSKCTKPTSRETESPRKKQTTKIPTTPFNRFLNAWFIGINVPSEQKTMLIRYYAASQRRARAAQSRARGCDLM